MALFRGTDSDDIIALDPLSPGIIPDPLGTFPSDDPDSLYGDRNDTLVGDASASDLDNDRLYGGGYPAFIDEA